MQSSGRPARMTRLSPRATVPTRPPIASAIRASLPSAQRAGGPRRWAVVRALFEQTGYAPGRLDPVGPPGVALPPGALLPPGTLWPPPGNGTRSWPPATDDAFSEPSAFLVPSALIVIPALRLAIVALVTPRRRNVVELPTWIVADVPSNCLIVIVEAVVAVTWPKTRGRITLSALMLNEPLLAFDSLSPIVSPTLRSDSEIAWPPRVIFVVPVTVIVRVQPSAVLSDRLEPSIEAIVTPPDVPNAPNPPPKANPPMIGPAIPRPRPPTPDDGTRWPGAGEPAGVVGLAPPPWGLGEAAIVMAADRARTIPTPATIARRIGFAPGSREENEGPLGSVMGLISTVHRAR